MKKLFYAIIFFAVINTTAKAQLEISPVAGYFFSTNINFYEGYMKIKDNMAYGINLGVRLDDSRILEFSYIGSTNEVEWRPYNGFYDYPATSFNITSNYFLLSGIQEVPVQENVLGFGTAKLGAGYFKPVDARINDVWRFSFGLGVGLKYFVNDKIGLRFQADLLFPLYFNGGGAYCGIGTGGTSCGVGVSSSSAIMQGDISAGLIFLLGNK